MTDITIYRRDGAFAFVAKDVANTREALQQALASYSDLRYSDLRYSDLRGSKGANKLLATSLYMLLDQPGELCAYKLVNERGEGPFNGGITYEIGKTVEVANANTDEAEQCAVGINLATLDWCMKEWRDGYRILVAEFTAGDIAAIPIGSDGKFRVHRCKIVGEKDLAELGLVAADTASA